MTENVKTFGYEQNDRSKIKPMVVVGLRIKKIENLAHLMFSSFEGNKKM